MGAFAFVCFSSTCWNAGLSAIVIRIHSPTSTRTPLSRNGTRQPQARNASSAVIAPISESIPLASSSPIGTPTWGQLAFRPRFVRSPDSSVIRTAPPHSPPSPSPCRKRSATSRIGAHTPIAP